jgi:hypothetical protein
MVAGPQSDLYKEHNEKEPGKTQNDKSSQTWNISGFGLDYDNSSRARDLYQSEEK